MPALVLWEVSRKQDYIFRSNKLKENKGASIIIEYIIEELPKSLNKNYEKNLIYDGGGNSLYKFDTVNEGKEFIKDVSEKVLKEYPGIQLFMTIEEYDDNKERVTETVERIHKKLNRKKNRRANSGKQVSFGIERLCASTGLPASCYDEDGSEKRSVSLEIHEKIKHSYKDSTKFKHLIPEGYKPIREFRDLAKEEEKNYLAVVHIDGNKMGQKFMMLKDYFKYKDKNCAKTNKEYLEALKEFSNNVKKAYEKAFRHMTEAIDINKEYLTKDTKIDENRFPVIPIIVAGDDITYVTNGKIGIESARIFLESLIKNEIQLYKDKKIKLNACAGVAIVKVSHPFSSAYKLAEDLCNNCKNKLTMEYENDDFSLIDWHIEQGSLHGSINEIRQKNYKSLDGYNLCIRPLYINNDNENCWTTYENFKIALSDVTNKTIYGNKIARNKIKNIRDVFKLGKKDTEVYLISNEMENYFSGFKNKKSDYCFSGEHCLYFDAIEVMDLFIELKGEGKVNE